MKKKWILIIISLTVVVIVSVITAQFLIDLLMEMAAEIQLPNVSQPEPTKRSFINIYILCFSIFFTLGCLPFVISAFAIQWKISQRNFWKPILILELIGLVLAYVTTPPDMISILLVFIIWQLAVIVNFIGLRMIVKKKQ